MSNETLMYYEVNAEAFASGTQSVDFTETQEKFLKRIPDGGSILDFGCGAGRDTRFFARHGYQVEAVDGSARLCKIAERFAGVPVRQMFFQDLNETERYDGIWACSSILHLNKEELALVLQKMASALKPKGCIYTSFKYGSFEGTRNGRFFVDFTETDFQEFLTCAPELEIEEFWVSKDVRPDRSDEKWLNLILRKR